jgi:hypothetical protein
MTRLGGGLTAHCYWSACPHAQTAAREDLDDAKLAVSPSGIARGQTEASSQCAHSMACEGAREHAMNSGSARDDLV